MNLSVSQEFFKLDRHTGVVFVAKPLKRDIAPLIRLTVVVTDESAPTVQQGTGRLSKIQRNTFFM